MRYESHAYGTREEIIKQLTDSGLTPGRSDRRMRELARAVVQLEEGDDTVTAGHTTYHVITPGATEHSCMSAPLDMMTDE